jgi:hypothetical protein
MVDHWEGEDVIITMEKNGGASVKNFEGKVTSIRVSGGDENTEIKYAFGEKMILFGKPKEKFKVEMDVVFHDSRFTQIHFGGATLAAGTVLKSSSAQDYWRIMVVFVPKAEQLANTTTATIVVPPKSLTLGAMQWVFVDCRCVTFERNFDSEDMLTGTISFEFSATDATGYSNFFERYTNGTTTTMLVLSTAAEYRGALTWNTTTRVWTGAYVT